MKVLLFILSALCGLSVAAENLTAKDGTVYHHVTIISADPDRMLIVHDGGGCQVDFKDLKPDSLTAEQRDKVESELRYYTLRSKRLDKIRLDTEVFKAEQRLKGLVEFEGGWVTPLEREEILIAREERKVELERKRVQLAKEKAELEKQQLQTEKARYLLEGESRRGTTYITYGYTSSFRRDYFYPVPYHFGRDCSRSGNSAHSTRDGAAANNRGFLNR